MGFFEIIRGSYSRRKIKGAITLFIIVVSFSFSAGLLFPNNPFLNVFNNGNMNTSFDFHAPINILSNDDLITSDAIRGGNGSLLSPYLIENWEVNASTSGIGVNISNTNKYIEIKYINITAISSGIGIQIKNVTNVKIQHVVIHNATSGIKIFSSCSNVYISNATVLSTGIGVDVDANGVYINDVDVESTTSIGIDIAGNNAVLNSSLIHDCAGTSVIVSGSGIIIDNTEILHSTGTGVSITGSTNKLLGSQVKFGSSYGVSIQGASNLVNGTVFENNSNSHVLLETASASYNNISNNVLNTSFSAAAIKITDAPDNRLTNNNVVNMLSSNPNAIGISISGGTSLRNLVKLNTLAINKTGVLVDSLASSNNIENNNFTTCSIATLVQGGASDNNITGNRIYPGFTSGVQLTNANRTNILQNFINGTGFTSAALVLLTNSNFTTIRDNELLDGGTSISITSGKNVDVKNNILQNFNTAGVQALSGTVTITIQSNEIINSTSGTGILVASSSNLVAGNNLSLLAYGLNITGGVSTKSNNVVTGNFIEENTIAGLILDVNTTDNLIFNNVFNNPLSYNVHCASPNNTFYNFTTGIENIVGGLERGGNWWQNYSGLDNDLDGFGDTNYTQANVLDLYPLVVLPQVNVPQDYDYYHGILGYSIPWVINISRDIPTLKSYDVYVDGELYDSGTWIDGQNLAIPVNTSEPAGFVYNYTIKYSYTVPPIGEQFGPQDTVLINIRPVDYQLVNVNATNVSVPVPALNLLLNVQGSKNMSLYVARNNNVNDLLYQIPGTPGNAKGLNVRVAHNETTPFMLNYSLVIDYTDAMLTLLGIDDARLDPYVWSDATHAWVNLRSVALVYTVDRVSNKIHIAMPLNTDITGEFIFIGTPELDVATDKVYYNNTESVDVTVTWASVEDASLSIEIRNSLNGVVYSNATWGLTDASGVFNALLDISSIAGFDNDNFSIYVSANNGTHEKTNLFYLTHIIVDSVAPSVIFMNPVNNSYYNVTFNINTYITDNHLVVGYYRHYLDNSFPTLFSGNTTFELFGSISEGLHTISVEAFDLSNNRAYVTVRFYRDVTVPEITVTSPANHSHFNAPFLISSSITETNLHSMYYRVDSYTNGTYAYSGNQLINSTAFSSLSEGNHFFVLYAFDLAGNAKSVRIDFTKDTIIPFVQITDPVSNNIVNVTFTINTVLFDTNPNLAGMYYRVDSLVNGTYAFNGNETFSSTAFSAMSNGIHAVHVYGIDLAGNVNYTTFFFTKDVIAPSVVIYSPSSAQHFNETFSITARMADQHPESMWFYISATNITGDLTPFGEDWIGTINGTEFDSLVDGTYTLFVVANDSAGNQNSTSVSFTKDILAPSISVNAPANNSFFNAAFTIDVDVVDVNYDKTWYRVNGSAAVFFEGTTTLSSFGSLVDGLYLLQVYASDNAGNVASVDVFFVKDTANPGIVLLAPSGGGYYNNTFLVNVQITDTNFNSTWYTIDDNSTTKTIFNGNETMDGTVFDSLAQGSHTVKVYANDSAGNQNFVSFSFTKDSRAPSLTLVVPSVDGGYWNSQFSFRVDVTEINLQSVSYRINSLGNSSYGFTANSSNPFSQFITIGDGVYTVYFVAVDLAGNVNYTTYHFTKDTILPVVTITSPSNGSIFNTRFILNSSVVDANFNATAFWYQIQGRAANYTFSGNDTLWEFDLLGDASYTLNVYSRDKAGNVGMSFITFTKDTTKPSITPLSPGNNTYQNAAFALNVYVVDVHFSHVWYTIDGGLPVYTYDGNDTIAGFSGLDEGFHRITFLANDSVGNTGSIFLDFIKDTVIPRYTITNPGNGSYHNASFTINILVDDENFDVINLKINNPGAASQEFSGNGTVPEWDTFQQGRQVFYFSFHDLAGNANHTTLVFYKDTVLPQLVLASPVNSSFFKGQFSFMVNIIDLNFSSATYRVNAFSSHALTANGSVLIDLGDWTNAPEGANQVAFTAFDLAGNSKTMYLSFTKDITPPSVAIINPVTNNSYFNSSFSITTSIFDTNLNAKWYKIDNGAQTIFTTAIIDPNFLALGQGLHTVDVFANDTAGNIATVRFSFVKDTILPNLTILTPASDTVFKTAFLLTVNVVDDYYDAMHYYIDNFTSGPTPFDGNSVISGFDPLSQGTHTVYIYGFDLAGNRNGITLTFVKDTVAPAITINTPTNGTVFNAAFLLGTRIVDAHYSTVWYRIDLAGSDIVFSGNATITGFDVLAQGSHTVYVYANDSVGNVGIREMMFIKDTEGPVPSFNQPTDQVPYIAPGIIEKGTNVKVSVLVTDQHSVVASVRIWVNITGTYVGFAMVDQGAGNFTYTISGGTYQGITVAYYFRMNDTLGNLRTSSTFTYFIVYDQDVPVVAVDNAVQYNPTVVTGSTITLSSTLRNYDIFLPCNVIYTSQVIQPSGKALALVFNDTISIAAGASLGVSLNVALPAGVTGTFTCMVSLKTGWIADGGYTIWVKQFTFVAS